MIGLSFATFSASVLKTFPLGPGGGVMNSASAILANFRLTYIHCLYSTNKNSQVSYELLLFLGNRGGGFIFES